MVIIFIRTLIIFITLVVVIRMMGKRQIGEMQPFEFIVTLIIADLACVPMADVSIPLVYGIVAILCLFLLHQIISIVEQGGSIFKKVISGSPSIVIDKDGVNLRELKKNNMGLEDLIESMRSSGYFSLDDLDYAIFESNGKLSALESKQKQSSNATTGLPLIIINNGKLVKENLSAISTEEEKVISFVKNQNSSVKQVAVMTVDENGRTYFKTVKEKFKILQYNMG